MPSARKRTKPNVQTDDTTEIDRLLETKRQELAAARECDCYTILLRTANIGPTLVDDVYDDLRRDYHTCKRLAVVIDSGGGDIDAAYNLASLLRRYGADQLTFIVPRWAKSAATLLACAGDEILMTPVAELGPLDPQITTFSPLEQRMEQFSPLHIESTLQLIREEYQKGSAKLADGLVERLQFPLTLGSYRKTLDISKEYLTKLLSTRMLRDAPDRVKAVAERLTTGYAAHSFCITLEEAQELGLKAEELAAPELEIVWEIHKTCRRRELLMRQKRRERMREELKDLPPGLLDALPELPSGTDGKEDRSLRKGLGNGEADEEITL